MRNLVSIPVHDPYTAGDGLFLDTEALHKAHGRSTLSSTLFLSLR